MLAFAKTDAGHDAVVVVVNLDPYNAHSGWLEMPLERFGLTPDAPYRMQDLLGGGSFLWQGPRNYVRLDPHGVVAHVFVVHDTCGPRRSSTIFCSDRPCGHHQVGGECDGGQCGVR